MNKIIILTSLFLATSCANNFLKKSSSNYQFDARLTSFQYPFQVQNYEFETQKQSLEMAYMDINNKKKQSQKVAVLLHGKNFSGFYWEKVANDLVKKDYRVIIPDQIGFGKSSKPQHYQYSFPQLALNTQELLKSLNVKKYKLVGHSMGGMLAVTMANMYENLIEKLILVNPIGLESYLDYVEFKDTDFFYKNELNKTAVKARNYQKKNYYDGKWSEEYEKLLIPTIGQINGDDWELVAWNNALTYGPIFFENILPRIKALKVPTVLIIGTRDKTGPGRNWKKPGVTTKLGQYQLFGNRFKRLAPKSKVIELQGVGHMPQFEDYKRFSRVFYNLF